MKTPTSVTHSIPLQLQPFPPYSLLSSPHPRKTQEEPEHSSTGCDPINGTHARADQSRITPQIQQSKLRATNRRILPIPSKNRQKKDGDANEKKEKEPYKNEGLLQHHIHASIKSEVCFLPNPPFLSRCARKL
jgi:hypothetical protein